MNVQDFWRKASCKSCGSAWPGETRSTRCSHLSANGESSIPPPPKSKKNLMTLNAKLFVTKLYLAILCRKLSYGHIAALAGLIVIVAAMVWTLVMVSRYGQGGPLFLVSSFYFIFLLASGLALWLHYQKIKLPQAVGGIEDCGCGCDVQA